MSKKKPGKLKKLSNFALAAAKFAAGGFIKSTKEIYSTRVLTCLACEDYNADTDECTICGCPIEAKASWRTEKCPKNKWKE
tara:strand:+ start:14309 stop:14551 length:243 start_codon:yes stop_codon:yes gene_type:complete